MPMNQRLLRPLAKGRTLYFNAAVDSDWATLGNWWTSGAFTTQASALPSSGDSVVLSATCDTNSGSAPTVVNFTLDDPYYDGFYIEVAITVTGNATFNDYASNGGTISGDATFNDSAYNNGGTITGDATFNDESFNSSTVEGDATFNGSASNGGTVEGDATFNGSAYNYDGLVTGNATFNGSSINFSTVVGTATFTGSACNSAGTAGTFVPNPPPSC